MHVRYGEDGGWMMELYEGGVREGDNNCDIDDDNEDSNGNDNDDGGGGDNGDDNGDGDDNVEIRKEK